MKDSSQIRINIKTMDDIKQLKNNPAIKYINLDIMNPNLEVIYYLLEHGEKYSYSDLSEEIKGYIYVSYDIFKQSQLFILDIINSIPTSLSELEIARFLYITIGKNISYDINILPDKNETFNLQNISTINNLWGSLYYGKGTNHSLSKLYLFLCRIMKINCKITTTGQLGYQKNILTIKNRELITDITQDIPFIQANFKTKNFTGYNDNLILDKKIAYILDDYSDNKLEKILSNLDYSKENIFSLILNDTADTIGASNLKPIELKIIFEEVFNKYCSNEKITMNNLYINNNNKKEHFLLINFSQKHYSFNYTRNSFVEIPKEELIKNLENKKIGLYLNEKIPFIDNLTEQTI